MSRDHARRISGSMGYRFHRRRHSGNHGCSRRLTECTTKHPSVTLERVAVASPRVDPLGAVLRPLQSLGRPSNPERVVPKQSSQSLDARLDPSTEPQLLGGFEEAGRADLQLVENE